jgi:hypothetical protein
VPWLRRLVAGLSPRRPGFDPRPIHMSFAVEKVPLRQILLLVLRFFPFSIIPLIFNYTFLLPGQKYEAWKHCKNACSFEYWGPSDRKVFSLKLYHRECSSSITGQFLWDSLRQRGTGTGVSPNTSVFPCHCYFIYAYMSLLGFPLSLLFHLCSILIFIYVLFLPEGQTGNLGTSQKEVLFRKSASKC